MSRTTTQMVLRKEAKLECVCASMQGRERAILFPLHTFLLGGHTVKGGGLTAHFSELLSLSEAAPSVKRQTGSCSHNLKRG